MEQPKHKAVNLNARVDAITSHWHPELLLTMNKSHSLKTVRFKGDFIWHVSRLMGKGVIQTTWSPCGVLHRLSCPLVPRPFLSQTFANLLPITLVTFQHGRVVLLRLWRSVQDRALDLSVEPGRSRELGGG